MLSLGYFSSISNMYLVHKFHLKTLSKLQVLIARNLLSCDCELNNKSICSNIIQTRYKALLFQCYYSYNIWGLLWGWDTISREERLFKSFSRPVIGQLQPLLSSDWLKLSPWPSLRPSGHQDQSLKRDFSDLMLKVLVWYHGSIRVIYFIIEYNF